MPDNPVSVLDRVARDLTRTYLHGSRTGGTAMMVATGQQVDVNLPVNGDELPFEFVLDADPTHPFPVKISNSDAAHADQAMALAIAPASPYLLLTPDATLPIWICNPRPYTVANPPALQDSLVLLVSGQPVTAVSLPAAVLAEVEKTAGSFVSLWPNNATVPVPAASWQPAIVVRFPLTHTETIAATAVAATAQVFELAGTPQGDRFFLDQLGLLGNIAAPPAITTFVLTLETVDSSGKPTLQTLDTWTIARTNLTSQSRPNDLARRKRAVAPARPYIALSTDAVGPNPSTDAIELLQMASIANSGGYFLRATAPKADATNLVLTVVLQPTLDTTPATEPLYDPESALLPVAANAIVFAGSPAPAVPTAQFPDVIRFNGAAHLQVVPAAKPGTLLFGWTRQEIAPDDMSDDPTNVQALADHFGYGVLSLVEYSAVDDGGTSLCSFEQSVPISPVDGISGNHIRPAIARSADEEEECDDNSEDLAAVARLALASRTSVLNLRSGRKDEPVDTQSTDPLTGAPVPIKRFFRSTLKCFSDKQNPWACLATPAQATIHVTPALRSLYGDRVPLPGLTVFTQPLFYTDALIAPSEWPGITFALYPSGTPASPSLTLEIAYHVLQLNLDNHDTVIPDATARCTQLVTLIGQLRGAGDVTIQLSAEPLVPSAGIPPGPFLSSLEAWLDQECANAASQTPLTVPRVDPPVLAYHFPVVAAPLAGCTPFAPQVVIARTSRTRLPPTAVLPADPLGANILAAITSVSSAVPLQVAATPAVPVLPLPTFEDVAVAFQAIIPNASVAFLRDQFNFHELWLVPRSSFPVADPTAQWNYATPRPLSNQSGSQTFDAPDFTNLCTATSPQCWTNATGSINYPLTSVIVTDQDFDELGRAAFRLLETQTADPALLTDPANAAAMRSLLAARETLADTLSQTTSNRIVPLYATRNNNLDTHAISRVANDAFRQNLSSFYAVSTIVQLPLKQAGDSNIQFFEGTVSAEFAADSPVPSFSDVLLGRTMDGNAEQQITVLYDLPGSTPASAIPALVSLTVTFTHVQMPLPDEWQGADGFDQGRWLKLAVPLTLAPWKSPNAGFQIEVADRVFPSKPILTSTVACQPQSMPVTRYNAASLASWGWQLGFALVNPDQHDVLQVDITYGTGADASLKRLATDPPDWPPETLLACLYILASMEQKWPAMLTFATKNPPLMPLDALAALSGRLAHFLSMGPELALAGSVSELVDSYSITLDPLKGCYVVNPLLPIMLMDTVDLPNVAPSNNPQLTLTAMPGVTGNLASLTTTPPRHSFTARLRVSRNQLFNPLLHYIGAPVLSTTSVYARNSFTPPILPLLYDMTVQPGDAGTPLQVAITTFFTALFGSLNLSSDVGLEVATSLVWTRGSLSYVTPISILPADVVNASYPTAASIANFVLGVSAELFAPGPVTAPVGTDSAFIRLRIKLTEPILPAPSSPRTILEIAAIDFQI